MKTHEPLVSVIVPTYNRAAIVTRALDSILGQTYRNFEILLVDDASTDNTREVITAIADPRLRYLRHDRNRGGSVARNTGINAAHGEYLAFLDSDDEWVKEKLAMQIVEMLKHKAHFSYCQHYLRQKDGTYAVFPKKPFTGGNLLDYVAGGRDGIGTPAVVVHRSAVVPFDENLSIYQDWDWIMRLRHKTGAWVFVEKPLCYYHFDAPVRTQSKGGAPMIERIKPFLEKYACELAQLPQVRRQLVWGCATNALLRGDRKLARSILLEYRLFPSLFRRPRAYSLWLKCLLP